MAADLHIHIIPESLLEDFEMFHKKEYWSSVDGNCYDEMVVIDTDSEGDEVLHMSRGEFFSVDYGYDIGEGARYLWYDTITWILEYDEDAIWETTAIWLGEVSWLKAGLFNDSESFIPNPIQAVRDLFHPEVQILTEELLDEIVSALRIPNQTEYTICSAEDAMNNLLRHVGSHVTVISH